MGDSTKERGFTDMMKDGLSFVSQVIAASIFPPIADGVNLVMNNVENRIIGIERRILRKMYSLLVIGFGMVFILFALFFFLKEFLGWSNSTAFLSIGIIVLIVGLLLKIGER